MPAHIAETGWGAENNCIGFGQFIALWLGLALHLTGPEMGYGTDVVGYLAGFAAVSVFSTPYWGRLADRIGPRKARVGYAIVQVVGAYSPLGGWRPGRRQYTRYSGQQLTNRH